MLERLILKIELDVVIVRTITHSDVEEDFDSAFRDRPKLVWLTEFHVVPFQYNIAKLDQHCVTLTEAHCHIQHQRTPS